VALTVGELADLVVGNYYGKVISDPKGSSRSDIAVTISKIDRAKVRVIPKVTDLVGVTSE